MTRKTHRRSTHRSKSYRRRHSRKLSRRHTRKNGGGCTSCTMRGQWGGRGGLGGADVGHAFTTGASQTLYQMTGRTPGLSSGGGKKRTLANRQAGKAAKLAAQAARMSKEAEKLEEKAEMLNNKAEELEEKAEKMVEQPTKFGMRVNAPAYEPSQNLLNRIALNRGLAAKEAELLRMLNNNNDYNENERKRGMRNQKKYLQRLMENY
jgi:hypothetical protein